MKETYLLISVGIALIVGLIADMKEHRRTLATGQQTDYSSYQVSDSIMILSPFLAFFYTDNFWLVSASLMMIILSGMIAQRLLHRLNQLRTGPELLLYQLPGQAIIVLLIYWLVVQDGKAIVDLSNKTAATSEPAASNFAWLSWWPYAIYGALVLANTLHYSEKKEGMSLFTVFAAFNILPFFTHSFWLFWLLGIIGFFIILSNKAKTWGTGAGAASAFFLFYILAAGFSATIKLGLRFFGLG
ncbi:hypothetical protein ACNKU7_01195 [Microbulbifer sp. SA54]|uniref:hypothetical protein n=1 Tax=Microbulbifer sp. SA54 TaxID=3401577 RepID=UPI003AAB7F13